MELYLASLDGLAKGSTVDHIPCDELCPSLCKVVRLTWVAYERLDMCTFLDQPEGDATPYSASSSGNQNKLIL
jgi:hypothetical protein